jgi:photosystem II stability/assembly factor-like uncharacterized protein
MRYYSLALLVFSVVPTAHAQAPYDTSMFRALQWRNVAPNRGGRVTAGVGVPGNPKLYYIGATGGGVWKTEDAGGRWTNVSDGYIKSGSIGDIAVFDANPSIIYVGTGEQPVRGQMSSYGDGMYKSTDAGRTWTHIGLERTRQIARVVVHPTDANTVYVAAQGSRWAASDDRGVYRSTDGGATWKRVLFVSTIAGATALVMDPTNPKILYATFWDMQRTPWSIRSGGPGSGVWKTIDGGDTWTQLKSGLPSPMGRIGIAVAPATPNRMYALIEADSGGLYRTDDAGATWRLITGNRNLLTRPWYFMELSVDPKNSDVLWAPGFSFFRSTDGGVTFSQRPSTHSDNHRLWINPKNGENLLLLNDGGAAISFDGGDTWSTTANQPTAQIYAVQADDLFPYNLYGGQQDAGSIMISSRETFSVDGSGGQNWRTVGGGESAHMAYDPKKPDVVFATGFIGELHRHDRRTGFDRGVSEFPGGQHLGSSAIEAPYRFNWSAPLAWSPFDPRIIYHGANVLFRTTDGDNWVPMSPDLTRNQKERHGRSGPFWHDGSGGEIYNSITVISPSARERGTIWVGTDDGLVQLTRDDGKTWKNVTPASWGEGLVHTIDVGPHTNGTAYVAFSRIKWDDYTPHLYVTHDYGATWSDLGGGLPQGDPARVIREDPVRKDLLFAGTEWGLWMSFDAGTHWQATPRGVPAVPISDLIIHHDDLVVGTEGRGYWILDDITPLRQLSPRVANAPLHLFKSRPTVRIANNPRSGGIGSSASIRYSLASALAATDTLQLDILNSAGTVVRRLATSGGGSGAPSETRGGGGRGGRGAVDNQQLATARGLNQFVWDFRGRETPTGSLFAMRAGTYTVRMKLKGTTVSQSLVVLPDPRAGGTPLAEREHGAMSATLANTTADINRELADLREVRTQARALSEKVRGAPASPRDSAIHSLVTRIDSLESLVVNSSGFAEPGPLDILHTAPKLLTDLAGLLSTVEGTSGPVTSGEREQFARLRTRASQFMAASERLLTADVPKVNAFLTASGLSPTITRRQNRSP